MVVLCARVVGWATWCLENITLLRIDLGVTDIFLETRSDHDVGAVPGTWIGGRDQHKYMGMCFGPGVDESCPIEV